MSQEPAGSVGVVDVEDREGPSQGRGAGMQSVPHTKDSGPGSQPIQAHT